MDLESTPEAHAKRQQTLSWPVRSTTS